MTQKIDNGVLPAFLVESEEQPGGLQRQVVKVAEIVGTFPLAAGAATEAKQDDIITELQAVVAAQLPDGHNVTVDNASIAITAASLPLPTGASTEATLSTLNGKVTACNTGAVVVSSSALPTGAATQTTLNALNNKLATSAAAADATANPSVSKIGAYLQCFNGTTWDRARGTTADGLLVNLGANNDVTVTSSALPTGAATAANQSTANATLSAIATDVKSQLPPSSIIAGAKTVATAGTAETLVASPTPCRSVTMTAEDNNTGKIYYGGSTVSSSLGDYLFPAQKITIEIDDVQKIYIDADVSTDGVKFSYYT